MNKLGIGLVGAGGFGKFCINAYREMPEVAVKAVADIDLGRARSVAPAEARVYGAYEELLADPEVHIVAINTPPYLHAQMTCQAAEAGKHIFVEKPLATSLADGLAAVRAAEKNSVKLSINYVLRQHPLHRLAVSVIHSGVLGSLQHWALENFAADDFLVPGHWFWDPAKSGGIHVEHGVHFFDLCNLMVGEVPSVVWGYAQRRADGRPDRVAATVRYGERVLATFYHSFNQIGRYEQTTIRLTCTRGHITIEGWIPTRLMLTGAVGEDGLATLRDLFGERLVIRESFEGADAIFRHGGTTDRVAAFVEAMANAPQRQEEYKWAIQAGMRDFVAAIHENRPPHVGARDGLLSLAVALAASHTGASEPAFQPPV